MKNEDSMGNTNFFFSAMPCPWVVLATWLHVGALQENTGKLNLILVLNKTLPRAHMELELDVLGIPIELVKFVVHLSKRKN
jgi:hypothetical protein